MEVLAILGSSTAQQNQNGSPNTAATQTEEPAAKTVQPTQQGANSADAGRDNAASGESPFARSSTEQAATERAPAETVVAAQLADTPPADDLEALARAGAVRAQMDAKVQSLLDGITTVDVKPTPPPPPVETTDNLAEPRTATPVDTYA